MTCIKPYWRKIPGSHIPVPLPCGQCLVCKVNKAREWAFRMTAESGYWPSSAFLTLTYAKNDVIELNKEDLQKAFKRARKSGLKFKYFACGEYGGDTGRPHYHVCIFYKGDLGFMPDISYGKNNGYLDWWPFGISNLGSFTRESARYTADYLLKELGNEGEFIREPPFRLVSTGVGKRFLLDNRYCLENDPIRFGNSLLAVPRYYRKFMCTWIDEKGVPEKNSRFISRLRGTRLLEYRFDRSYQRSVNITVRQINSSKEF